MSSDDNDKSTEQVLEYYQKYSQNRNLSKYFSGTSVSYLPPVTVGSDEEASDQNADKTTSHIRSEFKIPIELPRNKSSPNASSTESPSEDKKLEWDNGADIGYNSARKNSEQKLQKSSSLPIVNSSNLIVPNIVPSTVITHSASSDEIGILVFSSSSTSNQESSKHSARQDPVSLDLVTIDSQKQQSLSTDATKSLLSSHSDSDATRFVDFQKTIDYLKYKIGLPGAHSTPNVVDNRLDNIKIGGSRASSNPSSDVLSSRGTYQEKLGSGSSMSNAVSGSFSKKVSKPSIQKKIGKRPSESEHSSGASSNLQTRRVDTRVIELSISTPINVNCKALENVSSDKTPKAVQTESIGRHHIEAQFNCESNESDQNQQRRLTSRPKVNSVSDDMADSASSFEYISVGKNTVKPTKDEEGVNLMQSKTTSISGVLKEIPLPKNTSESSNVSRTSSEDIDRHLEVLQKLLKSKKINSRAKRKYIKQLLKELNELETTNESTTSSDLFIPKKDLRMEKPKSTLKSKVVFQEAVDLISSYKEESISSQFGAAPGKGDVNHIAKKLDSTYSIQPDTSNSGTSRELELDDCNCVGPTNDSTGSTKTSASGKKLAVDHSEGSTGMNRPFLQQKYVSKDVGVVSTDEASKGGTGKTDGTVSTISHSGGSLSKKYSNDFLLTFAENERAYQLNWINNEICHLSQLRNILESKSRTPSTTHPKTSVYNIAQRDGSKTSSERNYVIQTPLDVPSEQKMNYVLDGRQYVVSESSQKSSSGSDRVTADIEIHSDEFQTNIKVNTLCSVCKRVLCICPSKTVIQCEFPSCSTEVKVCLSCQQVVCVCEKGEANNVLNNDKDSVDDVASPTESSSERAKQSVDSEIADEVDIVSQEDFNSLQKVFNKCCCTVKHPNCGCNFVKKLLDKFQVQQEKFDDAVQTDSLPRDRSSSLDRRRLIAKTTKLCLETKIQTCILPTESKEIQAETSEKHPISLQTLRDVLCKSTQTQNCVIREATQTDQKRSLSDKCSGACERIVPKDGFTQSSNSELSNETTQTSGKLSKDGSVQARALCEHASLQATEEAQTRREEDNGSLSTRNKGSASSQANRQKVSYLRPENKTLKFRNIGVQVLRSFEDVSLQATEESLPSAQTRRDALVETGVATNGVSAPKESAPRPENEAVKFRNIGLQVLPSFDSKESQSSVSKQHKDAQVEPPKVNLVNKDFNTEQDKRDALTETCAECKKCKAASKNGTTIAKDSPGNTASTTASTDVSSDSRTTASSRVTCCCCKQKAFLVEVSYLQDGNDSLALCSRCYYNSPRYCSHNPKFRCRCWTYSHASQEPMNTNRTCKCCRMEVSKCPKRLGWAAYTVTLQKESNRKRRRSSKGSIKNIKIQEGWSRKSLKNKENYYKSTLGKERRKKKEVIEEDKDEMEKDILDKNHQPKKSERNDVQYTLPEYLIKNRPDFICSAEYRRQMLLSSRILREQQKDALKLNFLENNIKGSNKANYKLFTERQMKDINKKNYRKLPEVQEKLINQRENLLRHADRLISDTFAKKVQKSVLQGRGNFPIDKVLTSM